MSVMQPLTHDLITEICATVNRLSTNGICSSTFIHGDTGPWGIGYTFPRVSDISVLWNMESYGSVSQLYLSYISVICQIWTQFSLRLALD